MVTAERRSTRVPTVRQRWFKPVMAIIVIAVLLLSGAVAYVLTPLPTDESRWQEVLDNPSVTVIDSDYAVVLRPTTIRTTGSANIENLRGTGLIFEPGARVPAEAYTWNLTPLAQQGLTVVIPRPVMGFAIIDTRSMTTFTDLAPEVTTWSVGGHSMGGVRACYWAEQNPRVERLILAGSYCSNDLSAAQVHVTSVSGSADGLATPEDISVNADNLPSTATFVEIDGMSHAQFGSYGRQRGDGDPTLSDEEAREAQVSEYLRALR